MNKKLLAAVIAVSVIAVAVGGYIGYTALSVNNAVKNDSILSGVTSMNIELGGKTLKEAAQILSASESSPDMRIIKVSLGDKEIAVELRNSGFVFNPNRTVSSAYEVGRSGSLFERHKTIKKLAGGEKVDVNPVYDCDKNAFREAVLTCFAEQGLDFAKFSYELTENTAKIKINESLEEIDFEKLYNEALAVICEEEMHIRASLIQGKAATPEEIGDEICVPTTNARADEKDGITIIIPETNGVDVNTDDISRAIYEGKKEFEVPIKRENAEVTIKSIQGDFFNDVLGTFTTTYNQGVVGRAANVALAASKINNTVLNVDDIFSYNEAVGRITAANGYSMATVYTAEGMKPGIGGGICQVSSTLYNAVLYADLKIVNRQHHSYTVGYVKNGLDATVSYGVIDFRFKNNTKGPIKITATAGGGSVTVTIYGKKQNNNKITLQSQDLEWYPFGIVEKENPDLAPGTRQITQYGSNGVRASVMKTTTDEHGNVIKQESLGTNYYQPMNQIVEVGPKPESEPGKENGESTDDGEKPAESSESANTQTESEDVSDEQQNTETDESAGAN